MYWVSPPPIYSSKVSAYVYIEYILTQDSFSSALVTVMALVES